MDYHYKACADLLQEVRYNDGESGSISRAAFMEKGLQTSMEESIQDTDNIVIEHQIQTGSMYLGMHMP